MKQFRLSTLISAVVALPVGYLLADWMNTLLLALADDSAAWECIADVVWVPGTIAARVTHYNVQARVDQYFYSVLFAALFFAGTRSVHNHILRQRANDVRGK